MIRIPTYKTKMSFSPFSPVFTLLFSPNSPKKQGSALTQKNLKKHIPIILPLLLLLIDQIIKLVIVKEKTIITTPFFGITLVKNTGALFGILQGKTLMIAFLSMIIIGILLYYYTSLTKTITQATAINLIIMGLLSNTIDRLFKHCVIDYLCFYFWPCFNIADSMIVIGVMIYLITGLMAKIK